MSQPLDLCVTLTSPPQDAPSDIIASIALDCEMLGLSYTGDLLTDPLTQRERHDLQWYLEEYWMWPYEGFAQRGNEVEALLTEAGKRLYRTVFGSTQAMSIAQTWSSQPGQQRQISITSDVPAALSLPWELLHDGQSFLILRTGQSISIVRRLPLSELAVRQTTFAPPLRILLVTAQPGGTGFVDPRSIARELFDELQAQSEAGTIELEFLRPPTLAALRARLRARKRPIHVLHFDGHGTFGKEAMKQGMLAFEDEEGRLDAVKAGVLAQVLQDSNVRLVVLTACQSAMSSAEDIFSSVAAQLIRCGVDAVVAMSTDVLVASTTRYAEAFYHALATGTSVLMAHEQARQALHNDPRRHLQRRHQDEAGTFVELCDWWMPHLYQQHAVFLQPTQAARRRKKQQITSPSSRLNEEMPNEPRYGFSGRARELLKLERWLMQGKLVVISGFGGIGKTALTREAADWLTRTKMYDGACFVSFEHAGDATMLLSALGHSLGIYDGHYNPNDRKTALARLGSAFQKKRTLVIVDNLESILAGGEAPLESERRTQLWDVLLELAQMGAGVLLTSRDTAFGDERFVSSSRVAHLPLRGLRPNDAYVLATNLLGNLKIDRVRTPYPELRDLLAQLAHHPLAIQLVLPVLRDLPISRIRTEFDALLSKFVDETETGRNRSLLASLEYSLQRLSEEQQALVPRLAPFQGGASEDDLLAITEIPTADWLMLRRAMEQAALLGPERVHKDIAVPFLHFHPVLMPFLRGRYGAGDEPLLMRYALRYYALASALVSSDHRSPQPVRALARRELPNLQRALDLLIESGNLEAASDMTGRIARFLKIFGLGRERDELLRRVTEVVAARTQAGEMLTEAEWLHESDLGESEYDSGNIQAALDRFTALLSRIEAQPEGTELGKGSYVHCVALYWLARCLGADGQPIAAERRLQDALAIIDALLQQHPDEQYYMRQRGVILAERGDVLRAQGRYREAQKAYEERLKINEQLGNLRSQAVALTQLGTLALMQRNYAEAQLRYRTALDLFHRLGEPEMEAIVWHQQGTLAEVQEDWLHAEHYYRESLAIEDRLGNEAGAALTCNQLAMVTERAGRPAEAEGWCKRALELDERILPGSPSHARDLNTLARLLLNEVQAGRAPLERLAEARDYAERALAIRETFDASSEIWVTLNILADIADKEGLGPAARNYRRREREAFAAFAGNRYFIDREHRSLIADVVTAANGDMQARGKVETVLPQLEVDGWHIATAIQRIWAGERDWHLLAEEMDSQSALVTLRVLETLASSTHPQAVEEQDRA